MTDRVKGFVISLDHDIREDDCEYILNAIKMIKGVVNVEKVLSEPNDHIIRMRVEKEMSDKFFEFFQGLFKR